MEDYPISLSMHFEQGFRHHHNNNPKDLKYINLLLPSLAAAVCEVWADLVVGFRGEHHQPTPSVWKPWVLEHWVQLSLEGQGHCVLVRSESTAELKSQRKKKKKCQCSAHEQEARGCGEKNVGGVHKDLDDLVHSVHVGNGGEGLEEVVSVVNAHVPVEIATNVYEQLIVDTTQANELFSSKCWIGKLSKLKRLHS